MHNTQVELFPDGRHTINYAQKYKNKKHLTEQAKKESFKYGKKKTDI